MIAKPICLAVIVAAMVVGAARADGVPPKGWNVAGSRPADYDFGVDNKGLLPRSQFIAFSGIKNCAADVD